MPVSSMCQHLDEAQTYVCDNNAVKERFVLGLDKPLMQALVELLGPFQISTKELEASKTLKTHAVHRTRIGLIRHFQVSAEDNPNMNNFSRLQKTF